MASAEFHAFVARQAANASPPPLTLIERRQHIDNAMSQLPLAAGTSAAETTVGGVRVMQCERDGGQADPVLVWFHGGGYRLGSALAYRAFASHLAAACHVRTVMVDYALAPERPFPQAVQDGVEVCRALYNEGAASTRVVVGGDSAGGGLAVSVLVACRDEGLPLPAGGICVSPWADLTNSGESYETRGQVDLLFSRAAANEAAALYLGDHDPTDPMASPIFADLTGLPPLLILVGDAEVLLDDASALAERARRGGVEVEHCVFVEMPHVWLTSYPAFPEAVKAVELMAAFIGRTTAVVAPG